MKQIVTNNNPHVITVTQPDGHVTTVLPGETRQLDVKVVSDPHQYIRLSRSR